MNTNDYTSNGTCATEGALEAAVLEALRKFTEEALCLQHIPREFSKSVMGEFREQTLYGMSIRQHNLPPRQVIKLSYDLHVSDEFRASMNAWLLETFGERHDSYVIGRDIFVDPGTYNNLRKGVAAL